MTQVLSHSLNSSVSVRRPLVKLLALLMRIQSKGVSKPKTRQGDNLQFVMPDPLLYIYIYRENIYIYIYMICI